VLPRTSSSRESIVNNKSFVDSENWRAWEHSIQMMFVFIVGGPFVAR
jgi:hypothetical protein